MNKLEGFYELKRHGIPTIPWQPFTGQNYLDPDLLWTIRVAVAGENDFNLPRAIGVIAAEAIKIGLNLVAEYKPGDLILYYPYFLAMKSGVIEMQAEQTIIEAVAEDLWNLTTLGHKDITVIIDNLTGNESRFGNVEFLDQDELEQLKQWANRMRRLHRDLIFGGDSLLLEWSFAVDTNAKRELLGEKHLLFTECKAIKRGKLSGYSK
jgi:hypothetical protein